MSDLIPNISTRFPKWLAGWALFSTDIYCGYFAYNKILLPDLQTKGVSSSLILEYFIIVSLSWGLIFLLNDLYKGDFTASRIGESEKLIKITFTGIVLYIFLLSLNIIQLPFQPIKILQYWIIFSGGIILTRIMIRSIQKYLLTKGIGLEKSVIIGVNQRGFRVNKMMALNPHQGYDIIGFIKADDDPDIQTNGEINIIGNESELSSILRTHQISDVVVALEKPEHDRLMSVMNQINGSPVTVKIVPDLYDVISGLARTEQIAGMPLIQIDLNLNTRYINLIKRILDLAIAIPMAILCIPISLIVALIIKLDSKGPVIFSQVRIGKNGSPFNIYKFRSMVMDAEKETGPVWAEEQDPRVTKIGLFLRRFRLDEIPQLFNVILGNMSLIGPRPERPFFVEQLTSEFSFYPRRLKVLPGITGWAQIKHPYDRDISDVRQKLKYDFYYIENLSFNLDLKILFSTAWVMLSGQGR